MTSSERPISALLVKLDLRKVKTVFSVGISDHKDSVAIKKQLH